MVISNDHATIRRSAPKRCWENDFLVWSGCFLAAVLISEWFNNRNVNWWSEDRNWCCIVKRWTEYRVAYKEWFFTWDYCHSNYAIVICTLYTTLKPNQENYQNVKLCKQLIIKSNYWHWLPDLFLCGYFCRTNSKDIIMVRYKYAI